MERKVYDQLLRWKQERHGKSAVLVNGARRVGKSYIVKEFAQKEYRSYILLDFNRVGKNVKDLFGNYLATPYVLHPADVRTENGITYLPLYMTGLL